MLLSVIIPAYNLEKYIGLCFDSLLPQLDKRAEVIVIDDGSTDHTYEICKTYEKKYPVLTSYHKSNGGVSSARNYGLHKAQGDYIAWVDGDDVVSDDWYKKIMDSLKREKPDLLMYDLGLFWDKGKRKAEHANLPFHVSKETLIFELSKGEGVKGFFWNKVLKRTLFQNVKFDESISAMEDYKVITGLAEDLDKIVAIPDILYWYRQRDGSLTRSKESELYLCEIGLKLTKDNWDRWQRAGWKVTNKNWLYFVILYLQTTTLLGKTETSEYTKYKRELKGNLRGIIFSHEWGYKAKLKCGLLSIVPAALFVAIYNLIKK